MLLDQIGQAQQHSHALPGRQAAPPSVVPCLQATGHRSVYVGITAFGYLRYHPAIRRVDAVKCCLVERGNVPALDKVAGGHGQLLCPLQPLRVGLGLVLGLCHGGVLSYSATSSSGYPGARNSRPQAASIMRTTSGD